MYQMSGTIAKVVKKRKLLGLIAYDDIDTTGGQSGAPIVVCIILCYRLN
jgi:transcriptional regulator of nitric oxide reductase